ncbi:hypothetical protein AB5I41_03645 [Sphingomonas sp. MMS24-JH45]
MLLTAIIAAALQAAPDVAPVPVKAARSVEEDLPQRKGDGQPAFPPPAAARLRRNGTRRARRAARSISGSKYSRTPN